MNWPQGFRAGVAHCGLKPEGLPELALIVSQQDCQGAGLFTRNRVSAAPVQLCRQRLQQSSQGLRGLLVNSKNANAVTGPEGREVALRLLKAASLKVGVPDGSLLPMSTGVIGQPMPLDRYLEGLGSMTLGATPEQVATALMTTDTRPKWAYREVGGSRWLGLAKGSGMIHPDMATLLALVVSDASLPHELLQPALEAANQRSFHCITVDGDSSTNDSLVFLSNGASGQPCPDFGGVLEEILVDLARQVAFDGEGAVHQVSLRVTGLADFEQARRVGLTILTSPLVKTAIAGKDANWGRILAAAGRAGVEFSPEEAGLRWNGLELLREGRPLLPTAEQERQAVAGLEVDLHLSLGAGPGEARLWSCDLTHDYIRINGDYRS